MTGPPRSGIGASMFMTTAQTNPILPNDHGLRKNSRQPQVSQRIPNSNCALNRSKRHPRAHSSLFGCQCIGSRWKSEAKDRMRITARQKARFTLLVVVAEGVESSVQVEIL